VRTNLKIQVSSHLSDGPLHLQIVDMKGQIVGKHQYQKIDGKNLLEYPMSDLPNGNYVFLLYYDTNELIKEKLIKK